MLNASRFMRFGAALVLLASFAHAQTIRFVNDDAPAGGDGLSWATAFNDLQLALGPAQAGDQIWVAVGTYKPDGGSGDRSISFMLLDGVALFGGFSGLESTLEERAGFFTETVLSGDLNGDDAADFSNRSDNSERMLHIVDLKVPVRIDGFLVHGGSGGDAAGALVDASECAFVNCVFWSNSGYGGGAIHSRDSDAVVVNCGFFGNWSGSGTSGGGGAITNQRGDLFVVNSVFSGNRRQGQLGAATAGAILNWRGTLHVSQCTFVQNYNAMLSSPGGVAHFGLFKGGVTLFVDNCVFRGRAA